MSKKDILMAAQKILDDGIELVNDPFTGEQTTTAVRDRDEALLKPLEKALKIDDLIGRYARQGAYVSNQSSRRFQVRIVAHWILLRSLQVEEPEAHVLLHRRLVLTPETLVGPPVHVTGPARERFGHVGASA